MSRILACWWRWRFLVHFTDRAWPDFRDRYRIFCWNRMAFVPWAEFWHAKRAGQPAVLEKNMLLKRRKDKIITLLDVHSCYPLYTTGNSNHLNNSPGGPAWQAIALGGDIDPCAAVMSSAEMGWALLGFEDCASCLTTMQPTCQTKEPIGSTSLSPAMMPKIVPDFILKRSSVFSYKHSFFPQQILQIELLCF